MKQSRILTLTLVLIVAPLPARADTTTIATGGVYGGPQQRSAYCYVFNPTLTSTFHIDRFAIINQDGNKVTSGFTCDPGKPAPWSGFLAPQRTCVFSAKAEPGSTYGCRLVIGGDQGVKPNIRGTMDIRDAQDNVLTSSPLR